MDIEDPVSLRPVSDYIDGQTTVPMVRLPASISNPNTNEPLQQQRATAAELLHQALASATALHESGEWRNFPSARAQCLEHIADYMDNEVEHIALSEALTTGVVISQARQVAAMIPQVFRLAAAHLQHTSASQAISDRVAMQRMPWGPAVLITPWSAGTLIAAHKVATAMAAGCPVILKPSEWTPHACEYIAEAVAQCGLPGGVFQLVHGGEEVAKTLIYDERTAVVSFTGSAAVGRSLALACAADLKPLHMELGGVNPLIVLEEADLEAAAEAVVNALTWYNGQWCRRLSCLLVHRMVYRDLLSLVLDRLDRITIGDSLLPDVDMGPLIHDEQRQAVERVIEGQIAQGGVAHQLGRLPDLHGYFVQPTLITNLRPDQRLNNVLGPLMTVHLLRDDDDAVSMANSLRSAQVVSLFCQDQVYAEKVASRLRIGSISINGYDPLGQYPNLPRSGWGLSGSGDAGLRQSMDFFSGIQTRWM